MLKQMRMFYCRSNRLVRLLSKCSKPVLLEGVKIKKKKKKKFPCSLDQ